MPEPKTEVNLTWAMERIKELRADNENLVDALRRVYMWVSGAALSEDPDTASVEARRICREALGMPAEEVTL